MCNVFSLDDRVIIREGTPVKEVKPASTSEEATSSPSKSTGKDNQCNSTINSSVPIPAQKERNTSNRRTRYVISRKSKKGVASKLSMLMARKKAKLAVYRKNTGSVSRRPVKDAPVSKIMNGTKTQQMVPDDVENKNNSSLVDKGGSVDSPKRSARLKASNSPSSNPAITRPSHVSSQKVTSPRVHIPDALYEILNEPVTTSAVVSDSPVTRSKSADGSMEAVLTRSEGSSSSAQKRLVDQSGEHDSFASLPKRQTLETEISHQSTASQFLTPDKVSQLSGSTQDTMVTASGSTEDTLVTALSLNEDQRSPSPDFTMDSDQFLQLVVTPDGETFTTRSSPARPVKGELARY